MTADAAPRTLTPRRTKAPAAPFRVAVDSREQRPFGFAGLATPGGRPVEVVQASLPTGDYMLADALDVLGAVVERKSGPDLLGCIGRGRERFEAELVRLDEYPAPAIVIEVELSSLLREPRGLTPHALVGTLLAWQQRHAARWLFSPSRSAAERLALRWLARFDDDVREGKRRPPERIAADAPA